MGVCAIPIGLLLGFGSVIVVKSLMTQDAFSAWGWRILFVLGFLVAIVGISIRTRTEDSFVFQRHRTREDVLRYPATQVWRDMPLGQSSCAPRWSMPCSVARSSSTSYSERAT